MLLLLSATAYTRLRVVDRAHESFGDVAMGRIDASLASADRRPMVVVMEIDRRNIAMPLILAGGARGDSGCDLAEVLQACDPLHDLDPEKNRICLTGDPDRPGDVPRPSVWQCVRSQVRGGRQDRCSDGRRNTRNRCNDKTCQSRKSRQGHFLCG